MVNLQSHDTFRMSTVYFESDEELFSQDLNSTGDPEYRPPQYFRTGRHSYWPVQVCKVDDNSITLVYYETGETSCVAMPGKNLIPFSEQSITDVKLDQIKNKKL